MESTSDFPTEEVFTISVSEHQPFLDASRQFQLPNSFTYPLAVPEKALPPDHVKAGKTRPGETRCLEPDCNFKCSRIPQLRMHLGCHGFIHESSYHRFGAESEFDKWLSLVENQGKCTYMRRRGWQKNKNGSKTACFYCHRGGAYTSKASKKKTKVQGSCKTGVECTSSMKVVFWPKLRSADGSVEKHNMVEVEAYLQHYGHNTDLEHTRITKTEKDKIARRLSIGLSRNKVLDEIRETLEPSESPNRLHLISIQDIYNIEKNAKLKSVAHRGCSDPGTTVQAWIEKMQTTEDNPVLLIKYQQEKATEACACLTDDDFILVMQTSLQTKLLQRHGHHRVVCFDITQGSVDCNTLLYKDGDSNFYLCTLEVLIPSPCDDHEDVFPVAWFVCNRKDKAVMTIFLQQIKAKMGVRFSPSHLLLPSPGVTKNCDWFDIWVSVFGEGPTMLFATWHVFNDWRKQLNSISRTSPTEDKRLMTNMQTVLQERNVRDYRTLEEDFLEDLQNNPGTDSLASYFIQNFVHKFGPKVWALSHRADLLCNADSQFEEFHQTLAKTIYSEGFKRKQLDILIKTLLKYSRDKTLGKLRSSYKQNNGRIILDQTEEQHRASETFDTANISPIGDNGMAWDVTSINIEYSIESNGEEDSPEVKQIQVHHQVEYLPTDRCTARRNCPYRCDACSVCSHELKCSCDYFKNTAILCHHCHLICRYERAQGRNVISLVGAIAPSGIGVNGDEMMDEESTILKEFRSNSDKKDEASKSGKRDEGNKIVIYVFTGKEGESKTDEFEDGEEID